MTIPKWAPEDPTGKMKEGVNPTIVIVFVLALLILIGGALWALLDMSIQAARENPPAMLPTPSVEENEPALPENETAPLESSAPLPAVRGYILFGTTTFIVNRADAHLSKDRNRIAVIFQGTDKQLRTPLSLVFDLNPNTAACDVTTLQRTKIVVNLPIAPTGTKGYETQLTRSPDAQGNFPEMATFRCTRTVGGALEFRILGSDPETARRTGWPLSFGVDVTTALR